MVICALDSFVVIPSYFFLSIIYLRPKAEGTGLVFSNTCFTGSSSMSESVLTESVSQPLSLGFEDSSIIRPSRCVTFNEVVGVDPNGVVL